MRTIQGRRFWRIAASALAASLVVGAGIASAGHEGRSSTGEIDGPGRPPVLFDPASQPASRGQERPTNVHVTAWAAARSGATFRSSVFGPIASGRPAETRVPGRDTRVVSARLAVPRTPTITGGPSGTATTRTAVFTFTSATAGATFQCRLDNAAFAACASGITYSGLTYASHTFRVRAVNASGASGTATRSWRITLAAPSITAAPAGSTTSTSATFSFAHADPSVTLQCRLDNAAFAACTSPASYPGPLAYGNHTFRLRAVAGTTTSATVLRTWSIVPSGLPPAPVVTSAPTNPATDRSATFSFTDTDALATFRCSLDTAAFSVCRSPITYAGPLAFGNHTFRVRAVNPAGTGPTTTVAWAVVPRTPTIVTGPSNPSPSGAAQFTFTNNEPTATLQCSVDAGAFAACGSPYATTVGEGQHTFAVRAVVGAVASTPATYAWTTTVTRSVKARVLVIAADGSESNFSALTGTLDRLGVPYDTLLATRTDLTASFLATGAVGNYQGIMLTTGSLLYESAPGTYLSAFTDAEWTTLWAYEAQFGVRQVTAYTAPFAGMPPDDYGLVIDGGAPYVDTTCSPAPCPTYEATLTTAGRAVFSDLNPNATLAITSAWVYQATPADASVTPLLVHGSYAIASVRTYPDGRENLAVTADGNDSLVHQMALSYGLVNWVTRGLFLGQRKATVDLQIDDLFIDSDMWDVDADAVDEEGNGPTYRIDGADWQNIVDWQAGVRSSSSQFPGFTMEWAFNGEGAFGDPIGSPPDCEPIYADDTLTPAVRANPGAFNYVSHTYDHENLDLSSSASVTQQLQWNAAAASTQGLGGDCGPGLGLGATYDPQGFVQPDISGLDNPAFIQAAFDSGIRYLITDTSRPEWNNPSPNVGFELGPGGAILALPRHPTSLFYSLRTPEEWVDEYNWFFWRGSPSSSAWKFWDEPQTFEQILDHESDWLLSYLLHWDADPWMFHQANLGRYGTAGRFLLADLVDRTFAKYRAVSALPVKSLTQRQAGDLMRARAAYNRSGASATIVPCRSITITVAQAADVPVTGVTAGTTEVYGGQPISTVHVEPGAAVTVPISC